MLEARAAEQHHELGIARRGQSCAQTRETRCIHGIAVNDAGLYQNDGGPLNRDECAERRSDAAERQPTSACLRAAAGDDGAIRTGSR